jgi:hypothetical protein
MDPEDITVEVRSESLGRLGQINMAEINDLKITKRFNNVGGWTMTLPAEYSMAIELAQPGRGLIVTAQFIDNGVVTSRILMSGPVTSFSKKEDTDDIQGTYSFIGSDDNIVLADALAFPQPSNPDPSTQTVSNDIRTGDAETVLIDYVKYNIGSGAPAARKVPGLTEAPNEHRGATVSGNARFDKLGKLIGDAALAGGVGFEIVQTSPTDRTFSVYVPEDKSSYIRMDIENDMLDSTDYGFGAPTGTRFIVAGQGEGIQRQIVQVVTSTTAESDWGRIVEVFKDRRDTADPDELTQDGQTSVDENGRTITSMSVTPSDNVTMVYAKDWFLGDVVGLVIDEDELTAVVTEAIITVTEDGVLVGATIGDPVGFDYESKLIANQQNQEQRIAFLEKNSEVGITEGSSASRDTTMGTPDTALERLSLAVTQPTWKNTDTGRTERYYMSIDDTNGDPIAMANASEYGPGWLDNTEYRGLIGRQIYLLDTLDSSFGTYGVYNAASAWGPSSGHLSAVRTKSGIVQFSGLMENLTARSAGALLGNVPIGFRPDADVVIGINNNDAGRALMIKANGDILTQFAMTANTYVSFDNVKYPAAGVATWTNIDPVGTAGSDHTFKGGWTAYAGSRARFWKDPSSGLVWLDGLVTTAVAADISNAPTVPIFTLPAASGPYTQQHLTSVSSADYGAIGAGGSLIGSGVNYKKGAGVNTWISLNGCFVLTTDALSMIDWWSPSRMVNSWVNFNASSYTTFAVGICKDGLVVSRGLIGSGTMGSVATVIPADRSPKDRLLFQTFSTDARGRFTIRGNTDWENTGPRGFVPDQGGGNTWFSCDTISWWPEAVTTP